LAILLLQALCDHTQLPESIVQKEYENEFLEGGLGMQERIDGRSNSMQPQLLESLH